MSGPGAITASFWILAAAVAAGAALACFYLTERRIGGAARWASWAHGLVGATGVGIAWLGVLRGAPGPPGFAQIAASMLALALGVGLLVALAHLRRRRPSGLVVAVHATIGVGGFVILAATVF